MRAFSLSIAALIALTALVALRATVEVDRLVIVALQSGASYPLDLAANLHTLLGQAATSLAIAALLAIVIALRYRGLAWLTPAFLAVTAAVELALKFALVHAGPPPELYGRSFHPILSIDLDAPSTFPSGHVARLTFFALLIGALIPGRLTGAVVWTFVVVTMIARIYIGDHWLSDVLGGVLVGAVSAQLAIMWLRRWPLRTRGSDAE